MNKKTIAGIGAGLITLGGGTVAIVDNSINPYTTVSVVENGKSVQVLQIDATSTLPEGGTQKIIADTTQPKVTLTKWNGEVALGITSLDVPANTTGSRPLLSKTIEWKPSVSVILAGKKIGAVNDISMEAIPLDATTTMEDGGMEINLILNSKPTSNTFTFQLENWQNLDFFYQAPLWQEAGLKAPTADCTDTSCNTGEGTSTRPENVSGSYAVYYKNHANHKLGSTNYATGKAYHIFRPLVTDNGGNTTWADLFYSNGVLTVTVPQSFIDTASYPVKIDPTFGYTTKGGSQLANVRLGTPVVCTLVGSYVASVGDKIINYNIYGQVTATDANDTPGFALFSVVTGSPSIQLDATTTITIVDITNQLWTSSNISVNPIAGTQYCIGASFSAIPAGNQGISLDYDAGSPPGRINSTLLGFPGVGNNFSPTGTDSGRQYSIYATYTASSGNISPRIILKSPTIINTPTIIQ